MIDSINYVNFTSLSLTNLSILLVFSAHFTERGCTEHIEDFGAEFDLKHHSFISESDDSSSGIKNLRSTISLK